MSCWRREPDSRLATFHRQTVQDKALSASVCAFEDIWPLILDPDQTVALYATFSNINIRNDRQTILAELGRIAREQFHGCVTRNMTTSLFTARRR